MSRELDAELFGLWRRLRGLTDDSAELDRRIEEDARPALDWTGCDYRTMPGTQPAPSSVVQVNRRERLRRSWIATIDPDGMITRKDGVRVIGDVEMLRVEGLL